jgi:hypothetical protein
VTAPPGILEASFAEADVRGRMPHSTCHVSDAPATAMYSARRIQTRINATEWAKDSGERVTTRYDADCGRPVQVVPAGELGP